MGQPHNTSDHKWTYADYLSWPDDERWELIDGAAYAMSPAPARQHQKISQELNRQFANYLKGKKCEVYAAPFDIRLINSIDDSMNTADDYIGNVVQPDIVVVCDQNKLDEKGCKGSPDLIIEILSPSTARMDMTTKFELYQRHAVKEYWIVHPNDQTILVFKLTEIGLYGVPDRYCAEDTIPVILLGDLVIDLESVFNS